MATREEVAEAYNYIDELWRVTFGDTPDCSNALYDGDYGKSLEQAQSDKHAYVLQNIRFTPEGRYLDIGCGWGAMLAAIQRCGGRSVGISVSERQVAACRRAGLEAHVIDWRDDEVGKLGKFDGIMSIEAIEHFCSADEYLSGKQDAVYHRFFALCHGMLADKGRLYLQSQLWGRNTPRYETISLDKRRGSDEYMLASIEKMFPNSCLPIGAEQLERAAQPYFQLVSHKNGRLDYVYLMEEWRRRLWKMNGSKLRVYLKMARRAFVDRDFFYKSEVIRRSYYSECFRREVMDSERMVFEKTPAPS